MKKPKAYMSQSPQIGSMFLTFFYGMNLDTSYNYTSQSPQIGSMFLTYKKGFFIPVSVYVAIPSNRVNVSYKNISKLEKSLKEKGLSQSPQIGSMFLTYTRANRGNGGVRQICRNPLKSGQCFLQAQQVLYRYMA